MSARTNHFVNPPASYKRDYRFYEQYCHNAALYIERMSKVSYAVAFEHVKRVTAFGGKFAKTDPAALVLTRHTEGNRVKEVITFDEMLDDIVEKRRIASPSLAIYLNAREKRSLLGMYIGGNVAKRNAAKHAMYAAKHAGDVVLEGIKNSEQTSFKINNNSLSGAHNSKFTVLWLRSAHSTLTSTCRTAAAYANANNEKLLWGNRHYYNHNVVIENIVSIIALTDFTAFQEAVDMFNLYLPTADECLDCIRYSSDFYWISQSGEAYQQILQLLNGCTPVERAAFMYIGDLYHLGKYNQELMRQLIGDMIEVSDDVHPEPDAVMKSLDSDMKAFIGSLTAHMRSVGADGKAVDLKDEPLEIRGRIASTALKTYAVLDKYRPIIRGLLTTRNMPLSVASFTSATRRAGVVSDTDSTIFTVQNWCKWYAGYNRVDRLTNAVRNAMVYIASQTVVHLLATMSGNMGVDRDKIHQLAMKNEYAFPVFALTPLAKHYYSIITEQEGNVWPKPKLEIKGVSLRSSKTPPEVAEKARGFIDRILKSVAETGKVAILPILKEMADVERQIIADIRNGGFKYFKGLQVKPKETYKEGGTNPYTSYELWEEVFAPKYGSVPPPPYGAIKINVDLDKPSLLKAWFASMEDKALATRMEEYLKRNGRKAVGTFNVPAPIAVTKGIPKEISDVAAVRDIVYDITSPFYLILEPLNIFMRDTHNTRLLSDLY